MAYDINKHGDFRRLYDTSLKRNYWSLGYFGGGALNVSETYELAKQFASLVGVPIETIHIDEVLSSRRYKHFKVMYSMEVKQEPEKDSEHYDNVWAMLTD